MTKAPSLAKAFTMFYPMPPVAPVTTTTFSDKSISILHPLFIICFNDLYVELYH